MSGSATLASLSASWPLPQPGDLAGAYAQSYAQAFSGCDPYQPNSFMAVQARTHGIVGFGLYLYQRALTDQPVVIPAVPLVQPLTVALLPDTVVGRVRAQAAAAAYLAGLPIGALLETSELADAMLQASGAAVQMLQPAADVQAAPTHMFTSGGLPPSFVAYVVPAAAT